MLKKLLRYPKIALINTKNKDFFGYKLVLDQEKIPYEVVDSIKDKWDLVILPKDNTLMVKEVLGYVKNGGSIISSYDYITEVGQGASTMGSASLNTFHPYGDGVIYYFSYNFGEVVLQPQYHSLKAKKNIISQWWAYGKNNRINNSKREQRIQFKNVLYRLIGPLTQIWYWPQPYSSCFCQRVDVDFPLVQFYKKDSIVNALIVIIDEFEDINFSLFLNHSFPSQNEKLKKLIDNRKNIEIQSHGCNDIIKHKDYCYSLDLLESGDIQTMLNETVVNPGFKIFAPPCEQVNKTVLDACQNLKIHVITAGGLGKDDLPRKCFYDNTEYDIYNIPTSQREFLDDPKYGESYYLKHFSASIKDNSLFCIYFHPYILLNKRAHKNLSKFLYYHVIEEKRKGKLWTPFISELADWWMMRDQVYLHNGDIIFKNKEAESFFSQPTNKLSIIKWYPDRIKKLI